jgi:uncharacterized protein (DUF58 family)
MLFDEPTLRKLNQLSLVAHRVRAGVLKGERRSTRKGSSVEFADYRNYTPGDDLRRLDWNVYARLDRPFLKLMEEEEDLAVYILVDISASMDWGEGSTNKLAYALQLAGALAAVTLGSGDLCSIILMQNGKVSARLGPTRGAQQLSRVLVFLENSSPTFKPGGTTELDHLLREYSLAIGRPGIAFLLSDLFSPGGMQAGMNALLGRGFELVILHLLSPVEIDPPLAGDLRLVDVETGNIEELSIDGGMRELYRQRMAKWQADIQQDCRKRGADYIPVNTATPWDKLVLNNMRQAGVVK